MSNKKERDRANAKKRYQAKRAAGECSWCKEPAEPGHVYCQAHRQAVNQRSNKYRQFPVLESIAELKQLESDYDYAD